MRRISVLFTLLLSCLMAVQSQDKVRGTLQADLVSHYMWRGQDKGNVCIQPKLGLEWKGCRLALEGSAGFSHSDYEEMDIVLTYNYKNLTVGLLDEWGEDEYVSRYFDYGHETTHQFSAHLGYECKYGSIGAYTFFAGNDYLPNGKRAYSTYIELNVPFRLATLDWNAAVGLTPYKSGGVKTHPKNIQSEEYFEYSYADGFAVNMVSLRATKVFDIKGYQLPVYIEAHGNPYTQIARVFLGVTLFSL